MVNELKKEKEKKGYMVVCLSSLFPPCSIHFSLLFSIPSKIIFFYAPISNAGFEGQGSHVGGNGGDTEACSVP